MRDGLADERLRFRHESHILGRACGQVNEDRLYVAAE
jgi:hypothetical protein